MQSIHNYFKTNLIRQQPVSIVFSLSLQMVGILSFGLISVNLCTIAQINQQMTSPNYQPLESIWYIGMCSLMTTMVMVMPILIGAIIFVILRSLRPLKKFTDALLINSSEPNILANFVFAEMPVELRPFLQIYNKLVSTISEAGIQQQQFIASLSHELRTSLSLVSGYLQHISRRKVNLTKSQQEALNIATTETEHIIQILQDSLELARVKNCGLPLNFEWLNLNEVANSAVRLTEKFQHRIVQVTANCPKIIIKTDPDRLLQLLIYLIDNAIQSSKSHHPITLKLEEKNNLVIIQVSNHGCNLGNSQISYQPINLFNVYFPKTISLKLAIIEALVKQMGGNIFALSHVSKETSLVVRLIK